MITKFNIKESSELVIVDIHIELDEYTPKKYWLQEIKEMLGQVGYNASIINPTFHGDSTNTFLHVSLKGKLSHIQKFCDKFGLEYEITADTNKDNFTEEQLKFLNSCAEKWTVNEKTGLIDAKYVFAHQKNFNNLLGLKFGKVIEFHVNDNNLTNCIGFPIKCKILDCSNNNITDLNGLRIEKLELFDISDNPLISLLGAPQEVSKLYADNTKLITLEGCPNITKSLTIENTPLETLDGIKIEKNWSTLSIKGCKSFIDIDSLKDIYDTISALYCKDSAIEDIVSKNGEIGVDPIFTGNYPDLLDNI